MKYYTIKELAKILGVPEGSMKNYLINCPDYTLRKRVNLKSGGFHYLYPDSVITVLKERLFLLANSLSMHSVGSVLKARFLGNPFPEEVLCKIDGSLRVKKDFVDLLAKEKWRNRSKLNGFKKAIERAFTKYTGKKAYANECSGLKEKEKFYSRSEFAKMFKCHVFTMHNILVRLKGEGAVSKEMRCGKSSSTKYSEKLIPVIKTTPYFLKKEGYPTLTDMKQILGCASFNTLSSFVPKEAFVHRGTRLGFLKRDFVDLVKKEKNTNKHMSARAILRKVASLYTNADAEQSYERLKPLAIVEDKGNGPKVLSESDVAEGVIQVDPEADGDGCTVLVHAGNGDKAQLFFHGQTMENVINKLTNLYTKRSE